MKRGTEDGIRGWFGDGTPLGSATSEECRIDSIAQSWAVISGAASPEHAANAMAAVERELIRRQDGVALLFEPPFDKTPLDPGYIKGYPPGVRENGGQYTHAALWSVLAFAKLGDGDKATSLFLLLNPINHARTRADVHCYKVEPYVVSADVYAVAPHVGRGGWTWYTGSAGWMQRAGIEGNSGIANSRHVTAFLSVHSEDVAKVRNCVSIPLRSLRDAGREPAGRLWRYPACHPGRQDVTERPSGYSLDGRWRDSPNTNRAWLRIARVAGNKHKSNNAHGQQRIYGPGEYVTNSAEERFD